MWDEKVSWFERTAFSLKMWLYQVQNILQGYLIVPYSYFESATHNGLASYKHLVWISLIKFQLHFYKQKILRVIKVL